MVSNMGTRSLRDFRIHNLATFRGCTPTVAMYMRVTHARARPGAAVGPVGCRTRIERLMCRACPSGRRARRSSMSAAQILAAALSSAALHQAPPPDPSSPALVVACNGSDVRQRWAILYQQQGDTNASQLVLAADHEEALSCPQKVGGGCFQYQASWERGAGTTFVLNTTWAGEGAIAGDGSFLVQSMDGTWVMQQNSTGVINGSCLAIGCGSSYSHSLPCQCNNGCLKHHDCCQDYEQACPQPVFVLAPNRSDPIPGTAVTMQHVDELDLHEAAFQWDQATGVVRSVVSGLCLAQAPPPPGPNLTMTMYHVNQANYSGISNMNLGDAAGDALFDFSHPLQIYRCTQDGGKSHFPAQCDNPEEFAPDNTLVVTQVTVEIVNNEMGEFSRCNLCPDNGRVPFAPGADQPCPADSTCSCATGEYACWPNGVWNAELGSQNPTTTFWSRPQSPNHGSKPDSETASRWQTNLANRTNQVGTGTHWYSTLEAGNCDDPSAQGCHWRLVEIVKKVSSDCMRQHVHSALHTSGAKCFQGCSQPTNSSSLCYIECFYESLLGIDGGRTTPAVGGMSGEEIVGLWLQAFEACPALPPAQV